MRISLVRARLTSMLAVGTLVAAGLTATALTAPVALAEPGPVVNPTPTTVTADALPTVQIDGVAWTQVILGNTVYVGGSFTKARPAGSAAGVNTTVRNNLLAYDIRTGNLITSFAPDLNAQVKALAVSPDGTRLYVGGDFTAANGSSRYRIAAYNTSTGALITTFKPVMGAQVRSIVATNSSVYVGGAFKVAGGATRMYLAAFSASTGALLDWNPPADAAVNTMVLTPDGSKLIVGGAFANVNATAAYGLAALDPTTAAVLPWNATSLIRNAGSQSAILTLKTDGTDIFGSGYTYGAGGNLEGAFSADAATGNIKWVEDCHGDTYDNFPAGDVVYTVSHDHYCGNIGGFPQSDPWSVNMRHALAFTNYATGTASHDPYGYYDFYGNPTPSLVNWFPDLTVGSYTGKSQAAWSITGNSQYIVLGGEFPSVNNTAQQGLVRFAVKGVSPAKVAPQIKGASFVPTTVSLPTGAIRLSWQSNWDKDDKTLSYKLVRDSNLNNPVYSVTADSTFWNRPALGFIDSNVLPGQTYKYRLYATDSSGNTSVGDLVSVTAGPAGSASAYTQRVIADGAAPYWPMNETSGTTLLDNAGFNDADATAALTRSVTPGAIAGDTASTFDGATTAATRTAVAAPNTFTAQAWIKTTTTSGGKIIGFGNSRTGNSGSYDRHVYMDNDGRIWFGVYTGNTQTLNSNPGYNDGQWHQITASMGADGMKLSVDGKQIAQRADTTSGQPFNGYWTVGGDSLGGWPYQPASSFFKGSIDEVAVYPTVLTRQQVDAQWVASGRTSTIPVAPSDAYGAAVYNDNPLLFWRLGETTGTTAADGSPNGDQTGIIQNGVTLGATGAIKDTSNTAASFDGSDDFVASTNQYPNPRTYSEEAWFKTTATNGGKIMGFGTGQYDRSGGYDRHIYMNRAGIVTYGIYDGNLNTISTSQALNDGQWHHVVATQSATDGMKFYVDGVLVGTNPNTNPQQYDGFWRVGGDNQWDGDPFLNGTIDDAAVYSTVLTAAQVANHFNLGSKSAPVNQAPVAGFSSAATFLDATFTSTSSDPDGTIASYAWDFGDTKTATVANPTHTYTAAGTYDVTLTVTDNKGATSTVTNPITVTVAPPVNQAPVAGFSSTSNFLNATFTSTSNDPDGTIASYAWNFGDTKTATVANPTHTYTAAGTYDVTLTVTDNKGATSTVTNPITVTAAPPVNQAPVASFTATAMQLKATLDASSSTDADGTIASYAWEFGDGESATGVKPTHTFATAGSKNVTLTVTDNKGASTSVTQSVEVTAPPVNRDPIASFTVTTDGLTANFASTSTDPDPSGSIVSQVWDFGDNTAANSDPAVVHKFAASGTYAVKLTVTDNNGATASLTQNVTVTAPPRVNTPPVANFTVGTNGLAAAFTSTSTDSDGTVDAFSWSFGDNTSMATTATASHTYAMAGTYQVTLTVTDNNGGTNAVTKPVTVSSPAPVALVNDTFGRTSASGWGSADAGGAWTVAGGATNFTVNGGTGKIKLTAAGAGPSATLGAPNSADTSLTMDVSLDKAPTGGGVYVSVASRKVGSSEYRTTAKFLATGVIQVQLVRIVNGVSTTLSSANVANLTYTAGSTVSVKFEVAGSASVALRAKVWNTGGTEPTAWTTTYSDSSESRLITTGGIALYPYLSGSSTNAPVTTSFDNLKVFAVQP